MGVSNKKKIRKRKDYFLQNIFVKNHFLDLRMNLLLEKSLASETALDIHYKNF